VQNTEDLELHFKADRSLPEEADRGILKIQNSKQTEDGPHLAADQVSSQR
ncbi:hypothetical protein RclHR1_13670001, partial [Rhizophagus clarus]